MSRFIGSNDYESAYNALIHGMIFSNVVCVVIVLCFLFANRILYYLNQADSYILVFDYLIPIVVFAYIFMFTNLFSETLQAEGNSRTPTILLITSNILNVILDPIFIFNLNLGIKGAAYATVLSALVVFIIFIYIYISGRTKVPLSPKYFKLRGYIFVEIFKVALPNFLDNGLWAFSASFINSILITTTGEFGPILYSASNKLKSLLIAPVRGYGRSLMSVTGHLFGAHKFDELNKMFKYTLEVSFITTVVVMIAFIILRDYAFALFSITGMETEVFWIAVGGTVIMLSIPFSMISSKMLDGFGKSLYSLLFTAIKIFFEMFLIYELSIILGNGSCVLIGIMTSEIIFAFVYYIFLRYLFKNFDEKYSEGSTVRTFKDEDETKEDIKSSDDETKVGGIGGRKHKVLSKIPLIIALVSMSVLLIQIFMIPIRMHYYNVLISAIVSLIIGAVAIYLMEKLNKPKLSVLGFLISAVLLYIFMGRYGYISTLLFIISGVLILYIKLILLKIK